MALAWLHRWGQILLGQENWLFCLAQLNLRRMQGRGYEKPFRHFVSMLPAEGTVLDIGANLGVMSTYLKRTNPNWNIIAVEPIPLHVTVMKRLFNKFNLAQIGVLETAVGDYEGSVQMQIPIQSGVRKHGLAHIITDQVTNEHEKVYEVSIQSIDGLFATQALPQIIGMKIDVENYELEVLKGAIQTIQKYRPLLMIELWNDQKKDVCIQLMQGLGYEVKVLEEDQLVSYNGQDALDYFFIPTTQP